MIPIRLWSTVESHERRPPDSGAATPVMRHGVALGRHQAVSIIWLNFSSLSTLTVIVIVACPDPQNSAHWPS